MMKTTQLLVTALAALAFSPLAAQAASKDPGHIQLASAQATHGSSVGRATERFTNYGEVHPVELQVNKSTRTRAEVKAEILKYGLPQIGA
jgi:hypothetical protein